MKHYLVIAFLVLIGLPSGGFAAAEEDAPFYGTCNYLPEPPETLSGLRLTGYTQYDDAGAGVRVGYSANGKTISLFRFNLGYDTIDDAIGTKQFEQAVNDLFRAGKADSSWTIEWDSFREFPKRATEALGYFSKRAGMFKASFNGVPVDEFVAVGYTAKCLTKVRITWLVQDPESPYRYSDLFFQLDNLKKYFERQPLVTTFEYDIGTYTGESFHGEPYGWGTQNIDGHYKIVGEWKDGVAWDVTVYGIDGSKMGTILKGVSQ